MGFFAGELAPVGSYEELRKRYADQHGVAAGYLPSSLDGLNVRGWIATAN